MLCDPKKLTSIIIMEMNFVGITSDALLSAILALPVDDTLFRGGKINSSPRIYRKILLVPRIVIDYTI